MILYNEAISLAFGDPPDLGVQKLASAEEGSTSTRARTSAGTASGLTRRPSASLRAGGKARHSTHGIRRRSGRAGSVSPPYTREPLRVTRGIRATAWALVATGVAAPAVRRRLRVPAPVVLGAAWTAPLALC